MHVIAILDDIGKKQGNTHRNQYSFIHGAKVSSVHQDVRGSERKAFLIEISWNHSLETKMDERPPGTNNITLQGIS